VSQEATVEQKPNPSDDNFIFIDVSTFLTDHVIANPLSLPPSLSLSLARRLHRNVVARSSLPRGLQPRFLRLGFYGSPPSPVGERTCGPTEGTRTSITAISGGDRWDDFWKSRYLLRA